ncbi:MAG TPA: CapA family protein, partial [Planctomycetota bacterium]|nr:CapA family protein [Planctomycetota bacterium]
MLAGALLALAAWGCLPEEKTPGSDGQEEVIEFDASVAVVGEDDSPLSTASYTVHASASATPTPQQVDAGGKFRLSGLTGPVLVIIEAPGFLAEPLVVDSGASRTPARVRMLKEAGPFGERRIVMHFAGDVMLGRRYLEPTSAVSAVVTPGDGGASARRVVDSIAPLFAAAHVRSLNLETVIGTLPREEAYPKKRFLLQSPPEIVSLLDELEVSFVTLGNNHARDWLDPGVESILQVLGSAGVPYVGAGMTPAEARETLLIDAEGYKIGLLSYTTVNGDFVNDSLPLNITPVPNPLPASEAWQYELRTFEYHGVSVDIESTPTRRVGEVWLRFKEAEESGATETEIADLWGKLEEVYPELQDWVARRGHGGANPYDFSQIAADISSLRTRGADLVVVQFHGGFQFFEVKSEALQAAAYRAIDNGADLVVCHHPHVLQGFEWYQGKLIAYSLGNFVFDQDFLSTFPSAVLRVVFEERSLLEARVYPIVLENYRPVPLGG